MNKIIKKILLALIFLSLPIHLFGQGLIPAGRVEFDFVYDRLIRSEALAQDNFRYQLGPYFDDANRFSFGPFESLKNLPAREIELFSFVGEDFTAIKDRSGEGYESVRGGLFAKPFDNLFVYGNFLLDEKMAENENYTGKKWRGLAGEVEQAFVRYQRQSFDITAGRFASFWGPKNSLILSDNNALDGLGYSIHWGRLSLSYRLARLDGLNPDTDGVDQYYNRYFAGHRLDLHLSNAIRFGVFECVVFGGPGRQIDLYYLNPIIFFHSSQLNEGMNDNTFIGFDFSVRPRTGLRLYGQVLVDDFQIEKKTQGDQEPDQYGLLAGGQLVDIWPSVDIAAEYTRVTNWTFNQKLDQNRYLIDGSPLGDVRGNDFDRLSASITRWFGDNMALSAEFASLRQGEGRITDDWTEPWLDIDGDYDEPFPTGIVETTNSYSLRFRGFLLEHFFIDLTAGVDRVNNFEHIDGDDRSRPFLSIRLSSFISTRLSVD